MSYIVTDACIRCKFTDCVDVCPVDCFSEGENMLVIHPDECVDCGACVPVCRVGAIKHQDEDSSDGRWLELNRKYARLWPSITVHILPPVDANEKAEELGKFEKYFSPKPGGGSEWFIQKRPRSR